MESLDQAEYIVYFWNQRAETLWDLSRTKSLKGFSFDDFTRMHDISQIGTATSLQELQFGDVIWRKYILDTLEPIEGCKSLKDLSFSAKRILDDRVEPLAHLKRLERLHFPSNQFSTAQVAWLKAHLPKTVTSKMLQPYFKLERPLVANGTKDTIIVGKGKPFLDSSRDNRRIERYAEQFNTMHQWFVENPTASPDDYRSGGTLVLDRKE